MGAARSVAESIRDPGYTPSVRHTVALLDLLAAEDTTADAARALLRLGEAAVEPALREFESARSPLRGHLVDVLGDLAKDGHAVEKVRAFLLTCLHDDDAKTRRNAVIALAHHDDEVVERALLDYWRREPRDDHRRSVARSLARVGAGPSLALLRMADVSDPELKRACAEAVRMMERRAAREAVSVIRAELPVPDELTLVAHCRPGFEGLCAEELGTAWRPKTVGPGRVSALPKGRLVGMFRSRTMLWFGFPLAARPLGEDAALALADAIASEEAMAIFRAFTDGAIRYRIEWADAGHRRGATQRCVERVAKLQSVLVNDSRESTWEVVAREERGEPAGRAGAQAAARPALRVPQGGGARGLAADAGRDAREAQPAARRRRGVGPLRGLRARALRARPARALPTSLRERPRPEGPRRRPDQPRRRPRGALRTRPARRPEHAPPGMNVVLTNPRSGTA